MRIFGLLHGNRATPFQLAASYGVGLGAAALVILVLGLSWKTALLGLVAVDWVGGIVANAAEPVRAWWRDRPRWRAAFIAVHIVELPIVFWLSGGGIVFALFALILATKLSVFLLGSARSPSRHPCCPGQHPVAAGSGSPWPP